VHWAISHPAPVSKKYLNTEYLQEIYWFLSDFNTGFIVFADRFRRTHGERNMRSVNGGFMFIDSQLTRFSARQSRCLAASP
jgi:hypothetical protein